MSVMKTFIEVFTQSFPIGRAMFGILSSGFGMKTFTPCRQPVSEVVVFVPADLFSCKKVEHCSLM